MDNDKAADLEETNQDFVPPHTKVKVQSFINQGKIDNLEFSAFAKIKEGLVTVIMVMANTDPEIILPIFLPISYFGFPKDCFEYPIRGSVNATLGLESVVDVKEESIT